MTGTFEPRGSDGAQPGPPAPQPWAVPDPRKRPSALARAVRMCGIVLAVVDLLVLVMLGLLFVVEFTMAGEQVVSNAAVAGVLVVCAVLAVVSLVLAHASSRQLRRTGDDGSGATTAGLVLAYISTALVMFGFVLLWLAWRS